MNKLRSLAQQSFDFNYAKDHDDQVELQVVELSSDKPDMSEVKPLQIIEINPEELEESLEVSEHESKEDNIVSEIKDVFEALKDSADEGEHDHEHEHEHESHKDKDDSDTLSVSEDELFASDIPGAPPGTKVLVEEQDNDDLEINEAEELAAKDNAKKNDKWAWEHLSPDEFLSWVKKMIDATPSHSGKDSSGCERAISYLEKIDTIISSAMKQDVESLHDANKIEKIRAQLDDGVLRLQKRLDEIRKSKKSKRKKKADLDLEELQKFAGTPGIAGTYVIVPLLISRIGRTIINSVVSGGHDGFDAFVKLSEKFKLTEREKQEVFQFLADANFPLRQDRGMLSDEEIDLTSSDNFDFAANYQG